MVLIIDTNNQRGNTLKAEIEQLRSDLAVNFVNNVNGKSTPPSDIDEVENEFSTLLNEIKIVFIHTSNSRCEFFVKKITTNKPDIFIIGYSGSGSTNFSNDNKKYYFINAKVTKDNIASHIANPFLKDDAICLENIINTNFNTYRLIFENEEQELFKNLTKESFNKLSKTLTINFSESSKIY